MRLRHFLSAVAALSLAAAPVAAEAAAAPASRGGSPVEGEEIGGGFIIPLIGVLAVIVAVVLIADDSNDSPASP